MRHVELDARVPSQRAEAVFDEIMKWERFPELAPHVRATTVHATLPEKDCSSSWELHFRSGLLSWTEEDHFLRDELEIRFEQSDGDFDSFTGVWDLSQDGDDVTLHFTADFDFGIPSLEGILDPIAERVIKETVAWSVAGLFPGTEFTGADDMDIARPGDVAA
ncbi:cyclase [Streptomyces triculaminicus]|uniref:Cyclase n=2 Tax=Streptomyces TaxID=1883 RepID=A0A939JP92_9ACTN|nr:MULTISPECIES: SRPBCC family protein [Streptomyces]MBO0656141.1 cyclase [Streptomyces triculaminicus]QSY50122.1 cyclase [Streptomyces griseocarneus]